MKGEYKVMNDTQEYFKGLLFKAISQPGEILYFPCGDGLGFMTATDDKSNFLMSQIFFEDSDQDYDLFNLHVYIENDILFFHIGDYMSFNFVFGLNDKELIKNSLYIQDNFEFILAYMDEKIDIAKKTFEFTDRHKEVIKSYVLGTYKKELNFKDKFGKFARFETEKENQLEFLKQVLDYKLTKNNENIIKYISEKYDINKIEKTDIKLMNEILDYVLTRFSINFLPLGYCVHDKLENNNCKKGNCADCKEC